MEERPESLSAKDEGWVTVCWKVDADPFVELGGSESLLKWNVQSEQSHADDQLYDYERFSLVNL